MRCPLRWTTTAAMTALLAGCAHTTMPPLAYPAARTVPQVDDYHGVKVADPYRWLEDDNSDETKAWVEAENKLTFGFLDKIPERAVIRDRLTKLWNYERYGVPFKMGGRYFFFKNNGLQNQSVFYTMTSLDAPPTVLLDPNTLSADGTVALADLSVNDEGNLLAYGLAEAGSDWQVWKIRDTRTGKDLPDELHWIKFSSPTWTKDGTGLYYSRFDEPKPGAALTDVNKFQKVYYHQLGTAQSADKLIYQRPDHDDWGFDETVTDDGHYLVIDVSTGSDQRNRVYYLDLTLPGAQVTPLLDDFDAHYGFIDNDGSVFWFETNLDAPRGRVIAIDTTNNARPLWKEIIPQAPDTLEGVATLNNSFVCSYLKDAHSQVKIFGLDGMLQREVTLPGLGTITGFGGKRKDTETFYSYMSFTVPRTIYRYDLVAGASRIFRQPKVDFDPADYETTQVFYPSKDGTRVPMFLTYRKGLQLDGTNPTLLYGYGGFDINVTPWFSAANVVWLEMGGVYAVANLRGGGEYGEDWHQAGMKLKKQNVFDDFIGAAEWLIEHHYTSPAKLAINGASNGGLLVGACLTQRPDLFGAALPDVGVMDMLRFNKFTIGWAWMSDYGSPDDPAEFKALYAYSPLQNIKPGTKYPATLITTADHDDRVVPAHSFKFAATLQKAQAGPAPILIRIETRAGHGAGKPTDKIIAETADQYAFLLKELGMTLPAGF
ncbi:MAG TPA: prolyl oligopeptidase family serine peptidase [Opitutales bacterium]|nr:prolyl oligopeptidase family serine peptidase [Opitutales bacterium]